jgi:8-oxo-dGTP pyrophosphatase MutT (NUDIX family)
MFEDRLYFKAAFALIIKDGLILTSLRYDKPVRGLIGGLIDPNETKEQAMIREVKEECGLTVLKYEEFFSDLPSENAKLPVVTFFVSEFEGELTDPENLGIAWSQHLN